MLPSPIPSLIERLREDTLNRAEGKLPPPPRYIAPVLAPDEARTALENAVNIPGACMVCRWGNNELVAVTDVLKMKHGMRNNIPNEDLLRLSSGAGFFPANPALLPRFAEVMLEAFTQADMVGVWNNTLNPLEDAIINEYAPHATLLPLESLSPAEVRRPWSRALKGKKVLVVHPFSESIHAQYTRREQLFLNPHVLPPFELSTIKAVQSQAGEVCGHADWFAALDAMNRQIADKDFDIALIGAGAYGLPLAARIKAMGKTAIHMGGALQLMFGIMGSRWESRAFRDIRSLWKLENWVRPLPEETPANYKVVEKGCYW